MFCSEVRFKMIESLLPKCLKHRVQMKFVHLHSLLYNALKNLNNIMSLGELGGKCTPSLLLGNGQHFQNTLLVKLSTNVHQFFSFCLLSRSAALDFIVRIRDYLLDAVCPATAMEIQIDVKMVLENVL